MGKKLDALFGRNFRPSKFRSLVNLAVSRLSILRNQRHVRCSQARSDVFQLLQLGQHQRALLRVEQLIKEQNLLDAYVVIEGYLNLLIERINLLEQERECPDEMKEAVSGLLFAASRCGDFPELQEIKSVFSSRFGKEFTARAVELRNNCGVSHLIMQKLSTRQPNLENRMNVLKAIASENGIVLQLDEAPLPNEGESRQNQPEPHARVGENLPTVPELIVKDDGSSPSGSKQARQKYRDVADAAQAAFESAAQAAAAARAAVELSRSEPQDPDHPSSQNPGFRSPSETQEQEKAEVDSKLEKEILYQNGIKEAKTNKSSTVAVKNSITAASMPESSEKESQLHKQRPSDFQTGIDMEKKPEQTIPSVAEMPQKPSFRLDLEKKPMSVRTRRVRGY